MPPDGFTTITVPDEVLEQLMAVMIEYDCDSTAEAVSIAATVALERDEAQIARILAELLSDGA